ncbi:hypothetical protein [Rhizobium sp. TRM95796]|uniref:hypothetical protein n=1 Tax=Rhizobium sp. TRM95796 TaxID=2979862 RepID=UPI0021E76A41|nr:hypothetical protein [Rhizobium sp. TRM95796]MCV3768477.1 hypothetical protein [Rhizobium sp. TRM95796]
MARARRGLVQKGPGGGMLLVLRFVSMVLLACAVFAGVVDAIQSVAANGVVITSLGNALFGLYPDVVLEAELYVQSHMSDFIWDDVIAWILTQPAFVVLLCLSLILYLAAYRSPVAAAKLPARRRFG